MAVTVGNSTIAALNAALTNTVNAATSTVLAASEVFTFTPTKAGSKLLLQLYAKTTAVTVKPTFSISAGDLWAGKAITGTFGSTTTTATYTSLQVDSARVLQDDGTIAITLGPGATTKSLKTSYAAALIAHELL